jgi:protein-S-isoprenylcysteine O-methyltransferase Ste14
MLLTGLVTTSAMRANQFFSSTVRIQHERGQHVINKGPYAIIRHPGYLGGSLFYLGTFFILDSIWVLLPVALTIIVLIIRTKLEDDTLQRELNGYKEYTRKVRYRLIPGIW